MDDKKLYHEHKREIRRISMGSFGEDILQLLEIEKGILYTLKEFFIRPGAAIRNYFGVERYIHANPFKTLAILAALSAFVALNSGFAEQTVQEFGQGAAGGAEVEAEVEQIMGDLYSTMFEYFSVITFAFLPLMAGITRLFYRKARFNYAEHLVINSAMMLIPTLLFIFLSTLFGLTQEVKVMYIYYAIALGYQVYFLVDIFKGKIIWSGLKALIVTLSQYLLMMLIGAVLVIVYLMKEVDFTPAPENDAIELLENQSKDSIESSKGLTEEPK